MRFKAEIEFIIRMITDTSKERTSSLAGTPTPTSGNPAVMGK
jgi:hypothetical protein